MGLPRPPGGPITHPSARHQPPQTDPEAPETRQPDHTPAAASTSKGSQRKRLLWANETGLGAPQSP